MDRNQHTVKEKHRIVLSLVSHTNIGKTTLARTLLRRDVGEVRDQAHVTDESESHVMIETEQEALVIWDTPGFGYVGKILDRIERDRGAVGWLIHEVVDRLTNRALYCSLEAARNVKSQADIVLFLVNVREKPQEAGYVDQELKLLGAIGKPVIMILNQVDRERAGHSEWSYLERLEQTWREYFSHYHHLRDVMVLDAFSRAWHQELHLFDVIEPLLPPERRPHMARLRAAFLDRQKQIGLACAESAARVFWFASRQRVPSESESGPELVFQRLYNGLQDQLDHYIDKLTDLHGIEAEGRARLKLEMREVEGLLRKRIPESQAGIMAGALSGAGSGLAADMLSGGLSLGGGVILGALLGSLGGFSFAKLYNRQKGGFATWKKEPLAGIAKLLLGYYLLAAHHGRGKGRFMPEEPADFLSRGLEAAWPDEEHRFVRLASEALNGSGNEPSPVFLDDFESAFARVANLSRNELYPGDESFLHSI